MYSLDAKHILNRKKNLIGGTKIKVATEHTLKGLRVLKGMWFKLIHQHDNAIFQNAHGKDKDKKLLEMLVPPGAWGGCSVGTLLAMQTRGPF